MEDNSFWNYSYNDRNELTGAHRHWRDKSSVSGQRYTYAYDNIGNRTTAQFGGDTGGNNLQTILYTANSLNQYTSIVTPGKKDIIGAALATNSVTVNGATADRKWEYYHQQISVANSNQPVWINVTNVSGTFTTKGGSVFPANNQTLVYDLDGNLSFDGIWNYQWDGENRLVSMNMTNMPNLANSNRLRLDFAYDFMGRRIQKIVSAWNVSSNNFVPANTNRFVYDGWNCIAIINPQSSILASFAWGNDLSGTMTRAGGVGGLLMANISGTNCFTAYDGNGNITALINGVDKSLIARYEYSPYGELIRSTGLLARQNPFRFSTKFWDEESGLVYYGARYYDPNLGRWLNHDPSQEQGGINLYNICRNNLIFRIDTLGNMEYDDGTTNCVSFIESNIRHGLDDALKSSWTIIDADKLMYKWFSGDGDYDYKEKSWDPKGYDIGFATLARPDEFGNYLAGYAAGYAAFKSGNAQFIAGVYAAGSWYFLGDGLADIQMHGIIGGGAMAYAGRVSALVDQTVGIMSGEMAALDDDDE